MLKYTGGAVLLTSAIIVVQYPNLVALHAKVGAIPEVKAYLESPLRPAAVNGNGLG